MSDNKDKKVKRVTVDVSPDTHRQAKVKAAAEGITVSDKVRELLFGWLKEKDDQQKQ